MGPPESARACREPAGRGRREPAGKNACDACPPQSKPRRSRAGRPAPKLRAAAFATLEVRAFRLRDEISNSCFQWKSTVQRFCLFIFRSMFSCNIQTSARKLFQMLLFFIYEVFLLRHGRAQRRNFVYPFLYSDIFYFSIKIAARTASTNVSEILEVAV